METTAGAKTRSGFALRLTRLVLIISAWPLAPTAEAQQLATGQPGATVQLPVTVPLTRGIAPTTIHIEPMQGILDRVSVTVDGAAEIRFPVGIPTNSPPGPLRAARVSFEYADGAHIAMDCRLWVLPAPAAERAERVGVGPSPLQLVPRLPRESVLAPRPDPIRIAHSDRRRLRGVIYAGATEIDPRGRSEADLGLGVDLSGRVSGTTNLSAVYIHGWNPGLSPVFRYGMHRSRGHVRVRTAVFSAEAGEMRVSGLLTGVAAVADGISFHKTAGRLVGSASVGRPKYFAGGWGGHLFQGSIGFAFQAGSVSLLASDVARPTVSSRVVLRQPPQDNSELVTEDLEHVGALLARDNRVRGVGLETRLKLGRHTLVGRVGRVELGDASGERAGGGTASGTYSVKTQRASLSSQFRFAPTPMPGMALAGNLITGSGKLKVAGQFALVGSAHWNESSLLGRSAGTRGRGGAVGVEHSTGKARFHVQGNYRESQYISTATTRSISGRVRIPVGPTQLESAFELGEATDGTRRRPIASYRGSIVAETDRGSLMMTGSYRDYGLSRRRIAVDLSGSTTYRRVALEGGAGMSWAGIYGDVVNAWSTVEFPMAGELTLMLGIDYDRWLFDQSPYLIFVADDEDSTPPWRFTVSVRRRVSLSLPFLP